MSILDHIHGHRIPLQCITHKITNNNLLNSIQLPTIAPTQTKQSPQQLQQISKSNTSKNPDWIEKPKVGRRKNPSKYVS
jgi:hypothetical protein